MINRVRSTLKTENISGIDIPLKDRDQYYPEDFIVDMEYIDGKVGDLAELVFDEVPCIAEGEGFISSGAGGSVINIASFRGVIPDSNGAYRTVTFDGVSGYEAPTGIDGEFYVFPVFAYSDHGSARAKRFEESSYYPYTVDSVEFMIGDTPVEGDACLGSFVVQGGLIVTGTINERSVDMTISPGTAQSDPVIHDSYPVATGESVQNKELVEYYGDGIRRARPQIGDTYIFGDVDADAPTFNTYFGVAELSSSQVFVAYPNLNATPESADYGVALILTVVDGVVTDVSAPVVFEAANVVDNVVAIVLSSSSVLMSYCIRGAFPVPYLVVGIIMDGVVAFGTPVEYTPLSMITYVPALVALSDSKAVVVYYHQEIVPIDLKIDAVVVSIAGDVITLGTGVVIVAASCPLSAVALSDSKVLLGYSDYAGQYRVNAVVLSISGTSITANTPLSIYRGTAYLTSVSLTALSAEEAVMAWISGAEYAIVEGEGEAVVLAISGETVTMSSAAPISFATLCSAISVFALTSRQAIVAFSDVSDSGYGKYRVMGVSLGEITLANECTFYSTGIADGFMYVALRGKEVDICFVSADLEGVLVTLLMGSMYDNIIGIANENRAAGEDCEVSRLVTMGVCTRNSGWETGEDYSGTYGATLVQGMDSSRLDLLGIIPWPKLQGFIVGKALTWSRMRIQNFKFWV